MTRHQMTFTQQLTGVRLRSGQYIEIPSKTEASSGVRSVPVPAETTGGTRFPEGEFRQDEFPQEPRQSGNASGSKAVAEDPGPLLQSIQDAVTERLERREQTLREMQAVTVELAIAVASHLTFQAVQSDQWGVDKLVAHVIDHIGKTSPIVIELHPADLQLLQQTLAQSPETLNIDHVTFRAEASLSRGDCRCHSEDGQTLILETSTRISEIRRHWMEDLDDSQIERRQDEGTGSALRRFPDRRGTA